MKKVYTIAGILTILLCGNALKAQTVWTGATTTFAKPDFADWTLETSQDRITDNVWITRANNKPLFNVFLDDANNSSGCMGPNPSGTEWAYGNTADDFTNLNYQSLDNLIGCDFATIVDDQDMVLHIIDGDIYIDVKFTSWTFGSGNGGGFSYIRSTNQTLGVNDFEINTPKIFPNPSSDFIEVSDLAQKESYIIYNIIGVQVAVGNITRNEKIDIQNLANGLYFLKFEKRKVIRFIKE